MDDIHTNSDSPIIVEKLWDLWRRWRRQSQRLETSISFEQYRLLRYLDRHGPVSVSHLAEFCGVSLPAMTLTSQRLEKSRYVTRIRNEANQRQVQISITTDGRSAYRAWNEARMAHFTPLIGRLTPEQQQQLLTILDELSRPDET